MTSYASIYLGLGAVLMTAFMGFHFRYQHCERSTAYHVVEAMLGALLWPLYVLAGVVILVWMLWNHHRQHQNIDR